MTDQERATGQERATSGEDVIVLDHVAKRFGGFVAVQDACFGIARGEFFSLLGPSGCGKTTILKMIAGFETPTEGAIMLEGTDVSSVPPYKRNVNTVFQQYALFPHMSVVENVAFGLRSKRVPAAEARKRSLEMLDVVKLAEFANRRPVQLSGGQQQRVALARSLVNMPAALLLDEPLAALDLKLREAMQLELKRIQRDVGITFVFVTHDQGEALSMSNRIAVFNNGRIEQVATPREIYDAPTTSFVATFVGTSNVLSAERSQKLLGVHTAHAIRPERIRIGVLDAAAPVADDEVSVDAVLTDIQYLGSECRVRADLDGGDHLLATVSSDAAAALHIGNTVQMAWARSAAFAVADTGTALDVADDVPADDSTPPLDSALTTPTTEGAVL